MYLNSGRMLNVYKTIYKTRPTICSMSINPVFYPPTRLPGSIYKTRHTDNSNICLYEPHKRRIQRNFSCSRTLLQIRFFFYCGFSSRKKSSSKIHHVKCLINYFTGVMGRERLASDNVKMQNIFILPLHSESGRWIIWSLSTAIKHKYVYTSFYFRITNNNFEILKSNYDEKNSKGQKSQHSCFETAKTI